MVGVYTVLYLLCNALYLTLHKLYYFVLYMLCCLSPEIDPVLQVEPDHVLPGHLAVVLAAQGGRVLATLGQVSISIKIDISITINIFITLKISIKRLAISMRLPK